MTGGFSILVQLRRNVADPAVPYLLDDQGTTHTHTHTHTHTLLRGKLVRVCVGVLVSEERSAGQSWCKVITHNTHRHNTQPNKSFRASISGWIFVTSYYLTHKHFLVAVFQLIYTDAHTDQRDSFKFEMFEMFECVVWMRRCEKQAAESRTVMVHGGTIVSSQSVASCFCLVSAVACVSCAYRDTLGLCRARDGAAV